MVAPYCAFYNVTVVQLEDSKLSSRRCTLLARCHSQEAGTIRLK
jgi:hypothetical protein